MMAALALLYIAGMVPTIGIVADNADSPILWRCLLAVILWPLFAVLLLALWLDCAIRAFRDEFRT